jgi:hypothetical protein
MDYIEQMHGYLQQLQTLRSAYSFAVFSLFVNCWNCRKEITQIRGASILIFRIQCNIDAFECHSTASGNWGRRVELERHFAVHDVSQRPFLEPTRRKQITRRHIS